MSAAERNTDTRETYVESIHLRTQSAETVPALYACDMLSITSLRGISDDPCTDNMNICQLCPMRVLLQKAMLKFCRLYTYKHAFTIRIH